MNTTIRTKNTSNNSGRSQVKATGNGKQKTVSVEGDRSNSWNHGNAAGEMALKLGLKWHDGITHEMSDDGTEHIFTF